MIPVLGLTMMMVLVKLTSGRLVAMTLALLTGIGPLRTGPSMLMATAMAIIIAGSKSRWKRIFSSSSANKMKLRSARALLSQLP